MLYMSSVKVPISSWLVFIYCTCYLHFKFDVCCLNLKMVSEDFVIEMNHVGGLIYTLFGYHV
jgi:hypothetical protein